MTRPLIPRVAKPWRPRPLLPLLTLVVLAVGIAASAGVGMRTTTRSARFPGVPVASASHAIEIVNFAFAPQSLTITTGDSITWTNQDEAPHTVTTTSGPQPISSPMLSKGQSFTFTFAVAGTYSYYCAVHPDMRAQVVVNPAPAAHTPTPTPTPTKSSHSPQPSTPAPPPPTHSAALLPARPSVPASASSGHAAASSAASSGAAAPSTPPASAPPSTDAAAVPSAVSSSQDPLNPTLLLAGLTAGATVFCLLLAASRRTDES